VALLAIQALTGLASASALFLVASGLTVIFGVTRIVNFAHGSLFMLGAYVGWSLIGRLPPTPFGFALGALGAALALGVAGIAIEATILRRLYQAPPILQLLATFAVALIVQDVTLFVWGPDDLALPRPPWLRGYVLVAGSRFPTYDAALVFIGPAVLLALWLLFTRTRWGTLVRAATEDREMVGALGVDQRKLFTAVFALGAALAGLGGALTLGDQSANLGMDLSTVTDAFVVVVLGGLGSLPGAYLAAVLIGEVQSFGLLLLPRASLALAFVAMAVVLAVRPNGLLGRPLTEPRAAPADALLVRPAPPGARWLGALALAAAIAAPIYVGAYGLSVLTEAAIAVLFAASLHFIMGPGGMASFGQAAFFGIGAYAAGLLAARNAAMPLALVAAPVAAGLGALLIGCVLVRLAGVYFAMLTLAFAQIVWAIGVQWSGLTGGDDGILGVWAAPWASGPARFYWLALTVCLSAALLLRRAAYAPFGYALRAARDSESRAEAIGLGPGPLRLAAFGLAGAAAGLSGAVFAYAKGSVFPSYAAIPRSVDALAMVLLGGLHAMAGPIIGALAYTGIYDLLLQATELWRLALGGIILAVILVLPDGLAGAAARLTSRDSA
jgi:branched-chain amino acid transport system permease protein